MEPAAPPRCRSLQRISSDVRLAARSIDWIAPSDPRHEIWAAVAAPPRHEREAIALRDLADLTEPQIAEVMGVAPDQVGDTVHLLVDRLLALGLTDDSVGVTSTGVVVSFTSPTDPSSLIPVQGADLPVRFGAVITEESPPDTQP